MSKELSALGFSRISAGAGKEYCEKIFEIIKELRLKRDEKFFEDYYQFLLAQQVAFPSSLLIKLRIRKPVVPMTREEAKKEFKKNARDFWNYFPSDWAADNEDRIRVFLSSCEMTIKEKGPKEDVFMSSAMANELLLFTERLDEKKVIGDRVFTRWNSWNY